MSLIYFFFLVGLIIHELGLGNTEKIENQPRFKRF